MFQGQSIQGQQPLFGGQTAQQSTLFPQQQPQLQFSTQPFGQPQVQNQNFGNQMNQNNAQLQFQPQQPLGANYQQGIFNHQNVPDMISPDTKNVTQMLEKLKTMKNSQQQLFQSYLDQYKRINPPPQLQDAPQELKYLINLQCENLAYEWTILLQQQKELTKKLNEYITALGIVDRLIEDGQKVVQTEKENYQELYQAEQILKQQNQRLSYQVQYYDYSENQVFNVPQKYQDDLVKKPLKDVFAMADIINKLELMFQKTLEEVQSENDVESLIDSNLQNKLNQLTILSQYLFIVMERIKSVKARGQKIMFLFYIVDNFRQKVFAQIFPEKNKQIKDFHSLDISKNQLEGILTNDS